jgi:hypothetical protein
MIQMDVLPFYFSDIKLSMINLLKIDYLFYLSMGAFHLVTKRQANHSWTPQRIMHDGYVLDFL